MDDVVTTLIEKYRNSSGPRITNPSKTKTNNEGPSSGETSGASNLATILFKVYEEVLSTIKELKQAKSELNTCQNELRTLMEENERLPE